MFFAWGIDGQDWPYYLFFSFTFPLPTLIERNDACVPHFRTHLVLSSLGNDWNRVAGAETFSFVLRRYHFRWERELWWIHFVSFEAFISSAFLIWRMLDRRCEEVQYAWGQMCMRCNGGTTAQTATSSTLLFVFCLGFDVIIIIVGVRRSYIHVSREGIVTHVHVHVHPRLANALHLLPAKRQETNNNNKTN